MTGDFEGETDGGRLVSRKRGIVLRGFFPPSSFASRKSSFSKVNNRLDSLCAK